MSVRLNDLVLAWLASQNIAPTPNAYTVISGGAGGPESIGAWDTGTLGAQPSGATLTALTGQVTIQQSAQSDYAGRIAQGIAITSTGTSALDATYALDSTTLAQIQALATDCAAGLGFPNGISTFAYPDITGTPHTFDSTSIVNLYKAMRGLIFAMQTTLASRLQGNNTSWPSQSATIS